MLNEQTIATLNALKLFGMAGAFEERLNSVRQAELSHGDFVGLLVQDEKMYRDNLRLRDCSKMPNSARKLLWKILIIELPVGLASR